MSVSQQACQLVLLLVVSALPVACGTGISTDPGATDRSQREQAQNDASSEERGDVTPAKDAEQEDASIAADGATGSDAHDAATERSDGPSAIDTSNDGAKDDVGVAQDGSDGNAEVDGDRDVQMDASGPGSLDASGDRDGSIDARPGAKDSADDANDASKDVQHEGALDGFGGVDAPDACPTGCDPDEYFVDAHAAPGGNGSKQAPLQTISAAIDAHTRAPVRARTVHVAAGTYDASLGETFPLVLRGLSLEGAGADQTFIVGSGLLDRTGENGPQIGRYQVTVVIGDGVLPTNVSRLSVRPATPIPTAGFYGLFCDRGNATGEVASPAGQTHLDQISVGPGFDSCVMAVSSTIPSPTGCNLLVTRSTFTGGWAGVTATGCENSVTPGPVLLEVGTADPSSGNIFSWMQARTALAYGVAAKGCVKRGSFQYNTFSDSAGGIALNQPLGPDAGPCSFLVRHNTFEHLSSMGLFTEGDLNSVEEISDNRFSNVSQVNNQSSNPGVGMRLYWSNIGKVRRNVFVGNDIGVWLDQGAVEVDFGRAGDPGQNAFYCNSGLIGVDLYIYYGAGLVSAHAAEGRATERWRAAPLSFVGNGWDHVPPRVGGTMGAKDNGIEVYLSAAPDLQFDFSDASLVTTPCPPGRIP